MQEVTIEKLRAGDWHPSQRARINAAYSLIGEVHAYAFSRVLDMAIGNAVRDEVRHRWFCMIVDLCRDQLIVEAINGPMPVQHASIPGPK